MKSDLGALHFYFPLQIGPAAIMAVFDARTGEPISSIEQFQDGQAYICTGKERLKPPAATNTSAAAAAAAAGAPTPRRRRATMSAGPR